MKAPILALLIVLAAVAAGCTSNAPSATLPSPTPSAGSTTGSAGSAGAPATDVINTASVSNGNGNTGGQVRDVAPSVPSFTSTTATVENGGGQNLTFNGTVSDANGEEDLGFLYVKGTTYNASSGVQNLGANHTITSAERSASTEPASFGSDGYKVWNCNGRDGVLCWKYNLAVAQFAQAGTYTFNVTTGKTGGPLGSSTLAQQQSATVTSFSQIDFSPYPVDATGAVQTGANWGAWVASPGDSNVASSNYLKLTNNGDVAGARVQISFSGTQFVGQTDANYTVPFAGNVQFAWCDVTAGTTPAGCTMSAWTAANAGAATVTFLGKGHTLYVQYRVVSVPGTLAAQSYGAAFTATEL